MPFRFIDQSGRERTADGLASLLDLVRQGTLDEETLVFDEKEGRWRKAKDITYLVPGSVARAPEWTQGTEGTENEAQIAGTPEEQAPLIPPEPELSLDANSGAEDCLVPQKVSPAEPRSGWRRWTEWLRDDGTCLRVGIGVLALCALMLCLLIAGSPSPDAAEKFGEALGRLLVAGVVMFFFMNRSWGKGRAVLILSGLLFCFFGYFVGVVVVSSATNGKTTSVMLSTVADIQRHTQAFTGEVAALNVDSVFDMLDGKRACQKADLLDMRERAGVAARKTGEFISFFESRVAQAKNEVSAVDSSASASFMTGVNKSFPQVQAAFSLQRQYYQEIDGLLAFVLEQSGPYQLTKSGIRFSKGPDGLAYNARINKINELADSINRVKAEHQASQKQP